MHKKLLILDIDETLIHASEQMLDRQSDFEVQPYCVYKRPHLNEFLDFCFVHFDVAIWTSSSKDYAHHVISHILTNNQRPVFLWSRERCTYRRNPDAYECEWLKDLKKVKRQGYQLANVIMVDDTPAKLARNYGNLVPVKSFEGQNDNELELLPKFLEKLASLEDVRKVEKRFWRATIL
jgi:RNA polymerase II subunit A small phosphatase-like protein